MYKVKLDTGENGVKEFQMIHKNEKCPICGKELGYFTWNMFHGEVTSHCCGAVLQIKDWYVEDNVPEKFKNFVKSVGQDDVGYIFNIGEEWFPHLQHAIEETKIYNIQNDKVYKLALKYKNSK